VYIQVPLEHLAIWTNGSAVQLTQLAPQAEASVIWSTHLPAHISVPALQLQLPPLQVAFAPQAVPHVPQLFESV
jgi:hypothetical protein